MLFTYFVSAKKLLSLPLSVVKFRFDRRINNDKPKLPIDYIKLRGGWTCTKCSFRNYPDRNACYRCHHERVHTTKASSSLSPLPENAYANTPMGLRVELKPHQKTGLAWLLWREQQSHPGGILADDMGLGKTLAMIALILHRKNARREGLNLIDSNATLVVAPASLIFQWEKEILDRVQGDQLNIHVYVYYGPKSKRDIAADILANYDIVITTYEMVVSELKDLYERKLRRTNSILAKIAWERVILDEAHQLRNKNSLKARCCNSLQAVHRWCLTGTPIHNEIRDLFSLIRFLRLSLFSNEKIWRDFTRGERLHPIVRSFILRRTKDQICAETSRPIVDLQPKNYELVNLELQPLERHYYSIIFGASQQKVRAWLEDKDFSTFITFQLIDYDHFQRSCISLLEPDGNIPNDKNILALLVRLRQACVHFSLIRNALNGVAVEELQAFAEKVLVIPMGPNSLEEEGGTEIEANLDAENNKGIGEVSNPFNREYMSTKIVALMKHLDRVIGQGDKCVIVSQWTSVFYIVEYHLRQRSVSYTSITGDVKTEERQSRVDSFNQIGIGPNVMLLSLNAGGVGINLVGANHLFLLDLHWNPQLEQQAFDRIHRLGQEKTVFIQKFVCAETIEQRVLQLQEEKMALATSVLEG